MIRLESLGLSGARVTYNESLLKFASEMEWPIIYNECVLLTQG